MSEVLSKEELSSIYSDKVYNIETWVLNIELWGKLNKSLKIKLKNPKRLLFNKKIRDHLPRTKGIYIFTVEPDFPFPPSIVNFMYVGRVTKGNTFFKRFNEYVTAMKKKRNVRRSIQILTNTWPGKTWVYIYELNISDKEIEKIEQNIYNSVVPPLNSAFTLKRAKNSRSILN